MSSGLTVSPSTSVGGAGVVKAATFGPAMAAGLGLWPQPADSAPAVAITERPRRPNRRRAVMASLGRHVEGAGGVGPGAVDDRDGPGCLGRVGPRAAGRDVGRLELLGRSLAALHRTGHRVVVHELDRCPHV